MEQEATLKEIGKVFLKLGLIGFGGPAVHIAMMREEIVVHRNWLTEEHFLDLIGATNLIPGPNSTELAIHVGYVKGGWKGLLVAGLSFILPAVLLTLLFAYFYEIYGQLPAVQPFIYGIKPAIIAIIVAAVFPFAKKSVKNFSLAIMAFGVLLGAILGVNEIYLIFGAGFLAVSLYYVHNYRQKRINNFLPILALMSPISKLSVTNWSLFWIFLKIGSILYGSGYVLFAFLDTELVQRGILSREQLIDSIAVGQFTPGPVFSSVTFVGYQIGGFSGAAVSTLAIFMPSFVFVALLSYIVQKLRSSKIFSTFLDAVNVASVAVIASVCIEMAKDAIMDWRTVVIAVISLLIAFGYKKLNSALVVLLGAILGYLLRFIA